VDVVDPPDHLLLRYRHNPAAVVVAVAVAAAGHHRPYHRGEDEVVVLVVDPIVDAADAVEVDLTLRPPHPPHHRLHLADRIHHPHPHREVPA